MNYGPKIWSGQRAYKKKGTKRKGGRNLIALIGLLLLTGCGSMGLSGDETLREHYRQLWSARPTYSEMDTEETLRSGAVFYDVMIELCPEGVCVPAAD